MTVRPILVTGVAGFIGSHVARRLVADGAKVVGVDDLSMGHRTNIPSEIDFVEGDLSEASTYDKLPSQIDHILHLAGQSSGEISFDDPVADLEKNTVSTLRMVDYATRASASKLVYASSMSVYGDVPDSAVAEDQVPRPLSCYGVGKLAAEQYLKIFAKKMP
ncbi:MAG: NAD-dependent epimerase/dehydratase family protein, partial [Actinobacteria bacterium]|nr:NAD-dependent epimerase/dehydratase family protein [Actinomycetota bacterium]